MAKKNYENKMENLTAAFIKKSQGKETEQIPAPQDEDVKQETEAQKAKEQAKAQEEPKSDEVLNVKPKSGAQTSFEPEAEPENRQAQDVPVRGSDLNRYTFYITVEEKAALDQISIDEDMGKSEILRQVLDAGLEAVSPGIFERTKERADELRNRVKVAKNKNERKIYERLKKSLS